MNKKAKNELVKDLNAKNKKSKVQNSKVKCKEVTAGVVPIGQKNGYISIYLEPEVIQT